MLLAEQLQMRLPIHVSHQNAGQLLCSASTVHFHCAIIDVHGSVTQRFNWCTWMYVLNALPVMQSLVVGFDAVIFCKSKWSPLKKRSTNTQLESAHEYTSTQNKAHYFCIFYWLYWSSADSSSPNWVGLRQIYAFVYWIFIAGPRFFQRPCRGPVGVHPYWPHFLITKLIQTSHMTATSINTGPLFPNMCTFLFSGIAEIREP